jgi:hypothetical protein
MSKPAVGAQHCLRRGAAQHCSVQQQKEKRMTTLNIFDLILRVKKNYPGRYIGI